MGIRVWLQNMKSVVHDWPGSGETPSGIYPYIGFRKKSEDMEYILGACCLFIFLNCAPIYLIGVKIKEQTPERHMFKLDYVFNFY